MFSLDKKRTPYAFLREQCSAENIVQLWREYFEFLKLGKQTTQKFESEREK